MRSASGCLCSTGRPATAAAAAAAAAVPRIACSHPKATIRLPLSISPTHQQISSSHRQHICHAAAGEDGGADAAAATAAERRLLREQRRAARQQRLQSSQLAAADEAPDAAAAAAVQQEDTSLAGDAPAPAHAQAAPARRPSSRLAARRQLRARAQGARRRVPDALVPEDLADYEGSSNADDDGSDDLGEQEDVDEDVFIGSDSWELSEADADAAAEDSDFSSLPSSSSSEQQDPQEGRIQLPQSVLQQAGAGQGSRDQQQRQRPTGSSTTGRQGSQRQGSKGSRAEPLELPEANPMYLPVLTDEDLEADPPGHKSGYVAVIGRPNAGKSTLINAIVGQKLSIVTFKPQTTRHRVVGIASDKDYQMILFDTPGIMNEQRNKLDERMMAAVVSSIKAAEVIIAVVDSGDEPQEALAMFQPGPDWSGPPMAVLLNKTDMLTAEQVEELKQWYLQNCRAEKVFVGSALQSTDPGVEAIKAWAVEKLPEGPTLYPKSMVSEQPERFFVSEIIREQIFMLYQQEIPYCCQVQIVDFKERPGAKDFIEAVILVERETQAPILLGKGGAAINKLGSQARKQIEDFLGRPVYLQLNVKVAPSWRQQADKLKDFGYFDALYVS